MKANGSVLVSVLCASTFLLVIISGITLSAPSLKEIGLPPEDLPVKQVTFNSESGSLISGWFIPGLEGKGGVVLMHGVNSNRLQMLERARFINRHGYSVLLFDFQAHGESTGKHITFGYLEALDADAAFSFLEKKLHKKSIGIIGFSLGGAAALLGNVTKNTNALVLESVYPTIGDAIVNRLTMVLGNPGKYLLPLVSFQMQLILGFSPEELRPIDEISDVKGAVFIINGDKDKKNTLLESQRLFGKAHEPKMFWKVEGASHVDFYKFENSEYKKRVLSFFDKYL